MARSHVSGPLSVLTQETDGGIWIPATIGWDYYTGTWTKTRIAAGDYVMRKTAAADTTTPVCHIAASLLQRVGADPALGGQTHDIRGYEVTSIDLVYAIATAALTTFTYDLQQRTFANNVAVAVSATVGGTLSGALATATQANPYVTRITLGTPYVLGSNVALRDLTLELSVVAALTSAFDLYGCYVNCDYNLL